MNPRQSGETNGRERSAARDGIAIIGMSCLFPGAPNVDVFWRNILGKVDAVTDPPPEAWESDVYYDPTFSDKDKVYCRRGGYLGSLASFDPLPHGIPPVAVGGEPDQWLALQIAHDAMADGNCLNLPEDVRRRTEVILGKGTYLNGGNAIAVEHGLVIGQTIEIIRKLNPEFTDEQIAALRDEMKRVLPPMNAETVPGLIPNIIVGRIANRMDLMGPAYTVDAACASSLIAVQHAIRDLRSGDSDVALVGGAQVWMPVPTLNVFCQLGALSRRQQIRPFDKDADGTLLGEGIGMVVLKRLSDAERDGDRIYAVIRGGGMSSDGRGVSVMAPRIDGEELALRRAYESTGISPDTIGLIEAHGTATPVGDVVEIQSLTRVFGQRGDEMPHCAIGTVKSMISHTIPASGVAGLIKIALSLHHKVLPPTINCDEPNPKLELEKTPFYVNTETRPWIHGGSEPRRAGINAFGFGGINAHVIVEEYLPPVTEPIVEYAQDTLGHLPVWESEVFILEAANRQALAAAAERLAAFLEPWTNDSASLPFSLVDLASTVNSHLGDAANKERLAVIATSFEDLSQKLSRAAQKLNDAKVKRIKEVSGVYYFSNPLGTTGKTALLFPGEGSQYQSMLADLCLQFPEVRECFDRTDRIFRDHPRKTVLSDVLYPRPSFTDEDRRESERRLMHMDMAIEAVLTANDAMRVLLSGLGVQPDVVVGHSTGEYSAMSAAGILRLETEEQVSDFSLALNRYYQGAETNDEVPRAMMLAIGAERERVEAVAAEAGGDVFLAMDNCPHQAVLVGERAAVERARDITQREQMIFEELSFDRAYHTRLFGPYAEHLRSVFDNVEIGAPHTPVYSCTTAAPYPDDPQAVRDLVIDHWSMPVEFQRTVETLYDDGVRLFVECGARGNLSAFIEDTFRGRDFAAIPANVMRRTGITQLNHLVGLLAAHGVDLNWAYLYRHRHTCPIDLESPAVTKPRGRKIDLATAWPMLKLSDEIVETLQVRGRATTDDVVGEAPPIEPLAPPNRETMSSPVASVDWETRATDPEPMLETSIDDESPFEASATPEYAQHVLGAFFQTMDDFLGTQEDIMHAFLESGPAVADDIPVPPGAWQSALDVGPDEWRYADGSPANGEQFAFLGEVVHHVPGVELTARRIYRRDEDLFLNHHTLGHPLSGDRQHALAVMPLTMSLEVLAEAAAALVPGKRIVGMRNVTANRWLAFDERPSTVEVTARKVGGDSDIELVSVAITDETGATPAVEAIVELSRSFAPSASPIDAIAGSPSSRSAEELYGAVMFHGPLWQGVESIDVIGTRGAEATLRILPASGFLKSAQNPLFEIDPITLDAAGQVVGFWTSEVLESGRIVFPIRMDHLQIFGPTPAPGTTVRCRAEITLIGSQLTTSVLDVLDHEGRLWMRLDGWQDKRFDLPSQFETLMRPDSDGEMSRSWTAPIAPFGSGGAIACRLVASSIDADRQFWSSVWSEAILSGSERETFHALKKPEPKRLEWLAARTAAKDAVGALARGHFGIDLAPFDIEIQNDDHGAPLVLCDAFAASGFMPVVSLSHSAGMAAAVAGFVAEFDGLPSAGVGLDIERLKPLPDGFVETAFDDSERLVFQTSGAGESNEWILRAWCAKEAIGKALGSGLIEGPRSLQITTIDRTSGLVTARAVGVLAQSTATASEYVAFTGIDGDLVFATSFCELIGTRG